MQQQSKDERSLGELFGDLARDTATLVSQEVTLAKTEMTAKAKTAGTHIAVPAAMRLAAPEADPGVFVTASLAITFPFNLVAGIAIYTAAVTWIWS